MDFLGNIIRWMYPVIDLILMIFCLLKIRNQGGKFLALGFGILTISSLSWRTVELFDLYGRYNDIYIILGYTNFFFYLVFAGLFLVGISRICSIDFTLESKNLTKEVQRYLYSAGEEDLIDIKPLRTLGERTMVAILSIFSIGIIILLLFLAFAVPSIIPALILSTIFFIFGMYITARIIRGRVLGNSLKVAQNQFPEVHEIKLDIMRRLNFHQEAEIYIVEEGSLNTFLTKFIATRYIVLTSGLVNAMLTEKNRKELEFIIARAIGHLKAKHFRFWLIQVLIAMDRINPILYFAYERMCHYTSDRIGLVACKNYDAAISALVKLVVGNNLQKSVYYEGLRSQNSDVKGSFGALIAEFFSRHPHLIKRINRLREYADALQKAESKSVV